jgi:hypothetical protein
MTPFTRSGVVCALAFGAVLAAAGPASAQTFYGVTGTTLVRIDMGAHTATTVGPLQAASGPLTVIEDADFDGAGNLWAVRQGGLGGFPPTTVSQAYRVDIGTGNSTLMGDFGSAASLQSLAFRASNSAFYSVNSSGSGFDGQLVTANLSAGTIATVAGVPTGLSPTRVDALAFSPAGALYGIYNAGQPPFGSNDYRLFSMNLTTGLASVIGSIGSSAQSFLSLRFDGAGTAYSVDANTGDVFTVSLATGHGTLLFSGGSAATGLRGLAYLPAPGGVGLLGLGGLVAARRRRR